MNKKIIKRILSVFALVLTLSIGFFTLTACNNSSNVPFDNTYKAPIYNTTGQNQKAIIILPGIMGSNLINAQTGKSLWTGGGFIENIFMNNNAFDKEGRLKWNVIEEFLSSFMLKNENGETPVPVRAATMNDKYLQYGLLDEYKPLYTFLEKNFGENTKYNYQVVTYQYNWTNSNLQSAKELESFINANKYTDTILIGHSMGGLVIDYYLAGSQDNRDKVKGVITLGTPHLGAVDAAAFVLGGQFPMSGDISGLLGMLDGLDIESKIPAEFDNILDFGMALIDSLTAKARTLPSMYELTGNSSLYTSGIYNNDNTKPYKINGEFVTYDEFLNAMSETGWIKNNAWINSIVGGLKDSNSMLYIDGRFVTSTVNTYYFAGNGLDTSYQVKLLTLPDNAGFKLDGKSLTTKSGDGMVLVTSATAGMDLDNDHIVIIDGCDHLSLAHPTERDCKTSKVEITEVGTKMLEVIKAIIG